MSEVQVEFLTDMSNYPIYPTPPSTSEDSPSSYVTLSPVSYMSESSLSPGLLPTSTIVVPANVTVLPQNAVSSSDGSQQPYLEITEEPIDKFRFRYKSEMTGTHGCLNGEKSDKGRKMTYPSVKLHNFKGQAIIRCSIWQINHNGSNTMPHAHRLVKKRHGKEETDDPHEMIVNENTGYEVSFYQMGIIHTARKNIVPELIKKKTVLMKEFASREGRPGLTKKEEMEIKGLAEAESKSINLNVVCLRFDAFCTVANNVRFPICNAVFSHAINNLKSALTGELKIVRMDHCTSSAKGGREIFLLVERVTKKNVKVRFFELDDEDNVKWQDWGRFNDLDVHHQYAIVLKTPPYKDPNILRPVHVFMELIRPSDNARSEPKEFTYIPANNYGKPGCKRSRPNDFDSSDYDTASSGGSAGIPRTILNMSKELNNFKIDEVIGSKIDEVDSSELDKMLLNFDSKEFNDAFEKSRPEYEQTIFPSQSYSMDFPNNIQNRDSLLSNTQHQSKDFKKKVTRVVQDITEYLKKKPKDQQDIQKHMRHYISTFSGDYTALQMAAIVGDVRSMELLIKLIMKYNIFDVVNIPAKSGQGTVLHMAVACGDRDLVQLLVSSCKADIFSVDNNWNTPIHLACNFTTNILECLLRNIQAPVDIDQRNNNGNTALHRAVKRRNLKAVQTLCAYGANVNYCHPSNGYTPLRFAVEQRDANILKYLLYETVADPKKADFAGINSIQAAHQVQDEVLNIMKKFVEERNISFDIDIKMEPEEEDSDTEKENVNEEVKPIVPLPLSDDCQNILDNIHQFTEECLDEISQEIDVSGKWQDLTELLNLEHLLRVDAAKEKSPGRKILTFATKVATIKEIRGFLEALDEVKCVKAIDKMALQFHSV